MDVWADIRKEMRTLEEDGVKIKLQDKEVVLKASCIMMVGDNKSQYELNGMPANFRVYETSDKKICRFCKAKSGDMHKCPHTVGERRGFSNIREEDNVTGHCVFNSLKFYEKSPHPEYFLVPDFLHDILEGVAPVGFGHVVLFMVKKKWIDYNEINTRILDFPKTRSDKQDPVKTFSAYIFKPDQGNRISLAKGSCFVTFSRMFPLVFYNRIPNKLTEPYFWLAHSLIEVMRHLLRPTQTEASINRLEISINHYFSWHQQLEVKTGIKHHNLHHYPGTYTFKSTFLFMIKCSIIGIT